MTTSIYLERKAYDRLIDALLKVDPLDINCRPDGDAFRLCLGEFGDIWPECIREDDLSLKQKEAEQ